MDINTGSSFSKGIGSKLNDYYYSIFEELVRCNLNYHFFFFLGFFIFKLAGGIGILKPSSVGSVILEIVLITLMFLQLSLKSLIFSSEMLGVKFMRMVLWPG